MHCLFHPPPFPPSPSHNPSSSSFFLSSFFTLFSPLLSGIPTRVIKMSAITGVHEATRGASTAEWWNWWASSFVRAIWKADTLRVNKPSLFVCLFLIQNTGQQGKIYKIIKQTDAQTDRRTHKTTTKKHTHQKKKKKKERWTRQGHGRRQGAADSTGVKRRSITRWKIGVEPFASPKGISYLIALPYLSVPACKSTLPHRYVKAEFSFS